MKKALLALLALLLALSIAGCGGTDYVTYEDYQKLGEADWTHMTPDDFEDFLGVKGVERENSLGEGYIVYIYPGEEENTGIVVTFNDLDGDGKYYSNGMSPQGLSQ